MPRSTCLMMDRKVVLCGREQRLERRDGRDAESCDCRAAVSGGIQSCPVLWRSHAPKSPGDCSYGYDHCLKVFFRHWQPVFFKRSDVAFNCLFDVGNGFLLCFSLADATEQAGTFSDPVPIFTGINNDLSHPFTFPLSLIPIPSPCGFSVRHFGILVFAVGPEAVNIAAPSPDAEKR